MNRQILVFFLFVAAVNLYAFGNKETASKPSEPSIVHTINEDIKNIEETTVNNGPTRAEQVVKALLEAYPQQIEKAEYLNDDWALFMHEKWYYYADGRMLTEEQRENAENYRGVQFYRYTAELPPFRERSIEDSPRLANIRANRRQDTLKRSAFFEDLFQARTRSESTNSTTLIKFLGSQVRVHKSITKLMARIEELILAEAKKDPKIQTWLKSLNPIETWNWRNVLESQSRSFHSFGVAVDLLPKSLGNKQTYWLWSANWKEDWWNVPYTDRYHPPEAIIKIFETYGFAWGGKWFLFDTMHFEYRPEIFILNGLPFEIIK